MLYFEKCEQILIFRQTNININLLWKKSLSSPRGTNLLTRERNKLAIRVFIEAKKKKKKRGGGGGRWLHARAANDHRVDQRAGQTSFRIFRPTAPMQGWTRLMFPFCSFPSLSLRRRMHTPCHTVFHTSPLPLTCFPRAEGEGGRFTPIYVFRRFDPYFSGHRRGRMKGNGGEIRGKNSRIPEWNIPPVGRLCEYGRFPGDRALQRGPTTWKPPSCFRQTAPQPRHFVISDTYFRPAASPTRHASKNNWSRARDPRNQRGNWNDRDFIRRWTMDAF